MKLILLCVIMNIVIYQALSLKMLCYQVVGNLDGRTEPQNLGVNPG